ncbi:hypothetical protein AAFF_G00306640 [Aldrovandia affinis]|uniref:G-protein coupled receptors family 1 profile domain-containing protein n=1 Tax=Aldrovandia affinis TaxID=143900 RepID=A0AAD7W0Y0_9TELE|nr:hypothetical protein AAFF_G00306640 [Aldrovandia affinis]
MYRPSESTEVPNRKRKEYPFEEMANGTGDLPDYMYDDFAPPCELLKNQKLEKIVRPYVHSAICVVGLLGNLLVVVTYAFYKKAKSMTDVYLLNVALSDVLFAVALPLIIYNDQYNWAMGTWACKALRGIYSVNLYSGMLLLACISTDRYVAIVQARRSFRIRSRALVYSRVVCITVWALAFCLSIPTFVYYETYNDTTEFNFGPHNYTAFNNSYVDHDGYPSYEGGTMDEGDTVDGDTTASHKVCYFRFDGNETAQVMKVLVPSMQVAVGFFLPLLVMGFCYSSILMTLLRARNFQRHKAVRVVMAVVLVFVACHLPYNVTLLYYTANLFQMRDCHKEEELVMALTVTETLAYLHSCLNPVLYAFIGVKFRNHFCKILEDLWCMGKKYISARRSSRVTTDFYVSRKSTEGSFNENASSFTM